MKSPALPLTRAERIIGGLIGLIVGDACGVPVEFSSRAERDAAPVFGMRGWGTHHQPVGTWSDDASMALAHVAAFLQVGWDPRVHLEEFCRWYQDGAHTAHGHVFDIGITTRLALRRFRNGRPLAEVGGRGERDNGNGSLMRMFPVACWWAQSDPATIIDQAYEASALTHAHPRSQAACAYYCLVVSRLMSAKPVAAAITWAAAQIESRLSREERHHFAPLLDGRVLSAERYQVSSDGYVLSTLFAALWCLHQQAHDYRSAVLTAINLGGDTDTTAAVCGSLLGVHLGLSAIDRNWVSLLPRSSRLFDQAEQFAARCLSGDLYGSTTVIKNQMLVAE